MKDKTITKTARNIIYIWVCGLFIFIWWYYYNPFAFQRFYWLGGILSCITYVVLYSVFCNIYKAFRIASTDITELVFSQLISFGLSDLILYIFGCIASNRPLNILYGATIVILQLVGVGYLVYKFKNYLMQKVPPQDTLVIFGDMSTYDEAEEFEERLLTKYKHLFNIKYTAHESMQSDQLDEKLSECENVILYSVSENKRFNFMKKCIDQDKDFYLTPRIEDIFYLGCSPKHLLDTPLLRYDYCYNHRAEQQVKRVLDILFSLIFIIILSPIFAITALAIKIEDHGPIFFKQKRCTKNGRVFEIIKFRSMIVNAEKMGVIPTTDGDSRITKVGNIIRKTRIDEIPQFINILKGDMSFVGPRPERVEHVEEYTRELPEFKYRMMVNGGLTGYAQIYGKYNTSAYDKLRLDLMYIENQSLLLDIKIILLTIRTIFQAESTEGFDKKRSEEINRLAKKK